MGFVILSAGALVPVWPSIMVQFPAVDKHQTDGGTEHASPAHEKEYTNRR
jgi:hypothetical protein